MLDFSILIPGDQKQIRADLRLAIGGGIVAALVMSAVVLAVGNLSSCEARTLLEASLPTTRFLCSSVTTASATMLALMLSWLVWASASTLPRSTATLEALSV